MAGGGRGLRVFDTCTELIRTLPALQYDPLRPEDAAREPHELTHAPDALRGFCVQRAAPARPPGESGGQVDEQIERFIGFGG